MAKIYLRGIQTPIEIDDNKAKQLQDDWYTRKLEDVIKIGDVSFKGSEIKSIQVESSFKGKKSRYEKIDLNNFDFKEKVKGFEKLFLNWLVQNPKMQDNPFSNLQWYQELGAIRLKKKVYDFAIVNQKLYENLVDQWTALQMLRKKRKWAREHSF